ncbi:MAG: hypothetical protein HYV26_07600, partial [Candidatus Hydrogenedentes bacterium]|nr:hypothetical protein [Candidatus Hydrogenedentota bacterium]
LGNSNGGPQNVFYGSRGTFNSDSWTFTGEGGGEDRLQEPVKVAPDKVQTHLENWIQCIRANNPKTNADVHAGYAHSVASIMGYRACESGKRITYNAASRQMQES